MSLSDSTTRDSQFIERAERMVDLLRTHFGFPRATRTVIAVAGESGSGKSVTAIDLATILTRQGMGAAILHQDDYFMRPPRTNHEFREQDITSVGPQEVQLDLIAQHIADFRSGATLITGPSVNYAANRFDTRTIALEGCTVLVVEGTYVLHLADVDVRVFLEATHDDTAEARRVRNRDIDAPFVQQVLQIEHDIISRQRERADICITRDYRIGLRPGSGPAV
jgi:uridine kinase